MKKILFAATVLCMMGCQNKPTNSTPALDPSNMDTSVAPNESFYQYATGGWQAKNLSALGEEEQQLAGFGAGADDYISKPIKPKLLISRIQAILKRVAADKPASLVIDRERHLVIRNGERIELPRKEFALLALLASSPGKLFSREEIYSRIWGDSVVVGDRTIDVHVRKIRQKIGDGHISTVKGMGYKYEN